MDKPDGEAGQQKTEFERSEGVTGSMTEQRFPQHHHHQQIGYQREHQQQSQERLSQTAYRGSGQQQFGMDAIRTTAPGSPQSHYQHHQHHHRHQQYQLLQGHHYFINDLLSATAASSSISPPDLAVASSMQLLNGKFYLPLTIRRQATTLLSAAENKVNPSIDP